VDRRVRWLAVGAGAVAAVWALGIAAERVIWGGQVLPRVEAPGYHVARRDVDEVGAELAAEIRRRETEPITFAAGDVQLLLDPTAVGLDVDDTALIDGVTRAGRDGHLLTQAFGFIARRLRPDRIEPAVTWDDARLQTVVDGWVVQVAGGAGGGLRLEGTTVVGIDPQIGNRLDPVAALLAAQQALRTGSTPPGPLPVSEATTVQDPAAIEAAVQQARALLDGPVTINAPGVVFPLYPEAIAQTLVVTPRGTGLAVVVDPARLEAVLGNELSALEALPRNASIDLSTGQAVVVPERPGRRLDITALATALSSGDSAVTAAFFDVAPETTAEELAALGIKEEISRFTTRHPPGEARVTNIHRICDLVQDTVVLSGETFSLNRVAGQRTEARGFVPAPAIDAGEFVDQVGGGVSQFSTTLYNAVWLGGYDLREHQSHTYYLNRYPEGREATLSWPSPDLVWVNNFATPVLVHCAYDGNSVTVVLFGDKEGREVTFEGPIITNEVPAVDDVTEDTTRREGIIVEILDEREYDGFDARWIRKVSRPGRDPLVEVFDTKYKMLGRKVIVGASTTSTTAPTTTTTLGATTTVPVAATTTTTTTTTPTTPTTPSAETTTSAPAA
jgi:vancomycin resistance protein YoaR